MPGTRQLLLVRHGQTDWNTDHRFQGHTDIPLNAEGLAQAVATAEALAQYKPGLVLSSDLGRARATAAPLVAATGATLVVDPALREIELGAWEGLTHPEAEARFPEEFRDWEAGLPVRRGGGETEAEAGERAARFVTEQLASPAHRDIPTVAVVAHGLVLRSAMRQLAAAGAIELDGPAPHLGNGEWRSFAWLAV